MKKVLFVSTYGGFVPMFELKNIQILQKMGCEVHVAGNFEVKEHNQYSYLLDEYNVIKHQIDFGRTLCTNNYMKIYKQLLNLIKKERFDLVDTRNPIASIISRIAARKSGDSIILYSVHGFFFYKGCPLKNLLLYKPIEHMLARKTDYIVTINSEDFDASKKMKVKNKVFYIHGVGIDTQKIRNEKITLDLRKEVGCDDDTVLFASVGELNKNKNQITTIRAIKEIVEKYPTINMCFVFCGLDTLNGEIDSFVAENKLEKYVKYLGYRKDIYQIDGNADVFVHSSFREGLPVAIMEAMASGLPVLGSDIRGVQDLIDDEKGGYLFNPNNSSQLAEKIYRLYCDAELRKRMGEYNREKVEEFSNDAVFKEMNNIYREVLG